MAGSRQGRALIQRPFDKAQLRKALSRPGSESWIMQKATHILIIGVLNIQPSHIQRVIHNKIKIHLQDTTSGTAKIASQLHVISHLQDTHLSITDLL